MSKDAIIGLSKAVDRFLGYIPGDGLYPLKGRNAIKSIEVHAFPNRQWPIDHSSGYSIPLGPLQRAAPR